jgi:propionyl-CoA carboxylase alpha chain
VRDALQRIETHVIDDRVWVHAGRVAFEIPLDFALPDDAGRAGSTVSPMPGTLRRILVAVGDTVAAGQPLVIIEAMKMEHQVVSPTSGIVGAVLVEEGQQLDHGQPLVQVDAE